MHSYYKRKETKINWTPTRENIADLNIQANQMFKTEEERDKFNEEITRIIGKEIAAQAFEQLR